MPCRRRSVPATRASPSALDSSSRISHRFESWHRLSRPLRTASDRGILTCSFEHRTPVGGFMLPDPLHPAVVHLPIALAVLVPLAAMAAIFAIRTGFVPARGWWAVALLQALLAGSAYFAMETGHHEEERVERVVAEEHIHAHEEAGEWFVIAAGIGVVVVAGGLLPGRLGRTGRVVGALASLAVLGAAIRTGFLGGELVYRHGAAGAYTEPGARA